MPTYVYSCDACGKQFEQFQSFRDEPLTVCLCGQAGQVRRVIQPAGIVFKGSGWYINDSRGTGSSTVGTENGKQGAPTATADTAPTVEKSDKSDSSPASTDD